MIKFKSGAMATFVSTTCAYPGLSTEISIYGTGGSIETDADCLKTWRMKDAEDEDVEEESMLSRYGRGNLFAIPEDAKRLFGHRHVVEDMICAVLEGRAPEVMPAEALKAVKIVCAIYESAKSGNSVYI